MALAPLHDGLVAAVAQLLPDWRFMATYRHFRKRMPAYDWFLHVGFINHVSDCDVVANVAVEHLVKRKSICIVGAELGNIAGVGQRRWSLARLADIPAAATGLHQSFLEVGLPYLQAFSNLHEILRVLREEPKRAWLLCPLAQDPMAEANAIEQRARESGA
jgi:hypothetical protein